MLMIPKQAALAEAAIRVRYKGKYAYAALVLDVSTPTAPVVSLGVSDTSQAAAVAAKQTVLTGATDVYVRDLVAAIRAWYDTTAAREVMEGDFMCDQKNSLGDDALGATAARFATDAGTAAGDNLKDTWCDEITWDNDGDDVGFVTLLVPEPKNGKGCVAIRTVTGVSGTSGTPTLTRTIYKKDGTSQYTTGAITTATAALMKIDLEEPMVFAEAVVVRDTAATASHLDATTMTILYGYPSSKMLGV